VTRDVVLLIHAAATLFMTGVIWTIQLVHYPSFALAGPAQFADFHREHLRRITLVVGPAMLLELASAVAVTAMVSGSIRWVGLGLLAVVWVSTATLQIPQHNALKESYDGEVVQALVRGNWLRTGAWTLRAIGALYLLRRT